ncbi:MAG: hypothetical protein UW94_C0003G0132 [Parcubacteria group bacterium GW2011_GWA2_45_14]|nr:MAG: hypothetical protein UW94_C0003G0132 [Parcubacteria group bacterium GW2011_GWA2_45_14]
MIPFEPLVEMLRRVHLETKDNLPVWIERNKLDLYFLGVMDSQSKEFCERLGLKTTNILAGKLRRYLAMQTVTDVLWRMPVGIIMAMWHMWRIMPDVVISKGGYGSVPVGLAAFIFRVPLLLHESDAVMGLANKLMANWAQVITVGFAATRHGMGYHKRKTIVTGTPVRQGLARENSSGAKRLFGFGENEPVVLIMGGSQGAEKVNELTLQILPELIKKAGIIHLAGVNNLATVKSGADRIIQSAGRQHAYKLFGTLTDHMGAALMAADLVVSRAGATSLAELARLRKPAIIIPLALAAQDHQRANAQLMEVAEAVRVISQENLGRNILLQNIYNLLNDQEIREVLKQNIARFDYPNAAREIAQLTFKLARGMVPFQSIQQDEKDINAGKISSAEHENR